MTHESFVFWAAAAIPAIIPFVVNLAVRQTAVLKSSGADFLLLVMSFDLSGVLASSDLSKHVANATIRAALAPTLLLSFGLTLSVWLVIVLRLEPFYAKKGQGWRDTIKALGGFAATWSFTIGLTASHMFLFLYQGAAGNA